MVNFQSSPFHFRADLKVNWVWPNDFQKILLSAAGRSPRSLLHDHKYLKDEIQNKITQQRKQGLCPTPTKAEVKIYFSIMR